MRGDVPLVLYLDGWCSSCRASGELIRRADREGRVDIRSFRDDPGHLAYGIALADLERQLYVVELPSGRVTGGFAAVRRLVAALPAWRPLGPLLALAQWTGLGDRAYRFLAARRTIVPDPSTCEVGGRADR